MIDLMTSERLPYPLLSRFARALLLGALLPMAALADQPQLVFAEEWSRDTIGTTASQLAAWKKTVGFDEQFAAITERESDGHKVLKLAPINGSAPLITRDQFSASGPLSLEMVFSRDSPAGTWLRLSLIAAEPPHAGYLLQIYRSEIELVRTGEAPESLSRRKFPEGELPAGETTKVTLEINPASGKLAVLLNDTAFFDLTDPTPAPLGQGNLQIGLRSQSDVEASIESVRLHTKD